jgi:hypothetical protein
VRYRTSSRITAIVRAGIRVVDRWIRNAFESAACVALLARGALGVVSAIISEIRLVGLSDRLLFGVDAAPAEQEQSHHYTTA